MTDFKSYTVYSLSASFRIKEHIVIGKEVGDGGVVWLLLNDGRRILKDSVHGTSAAALRKGEREISKAERKIAEMQRDVSDKKAALAGWR